MRRFCPWCTQIVSVREDRHAKVCPGLKPMPAGRPAGPSSWPGKIPRLPGPSSDGASP